MADELETLIIEIAEEMNQNLTNKIPVELGSRAPLYGKDGVLDSLALVSLIVAVEQAIEDQFSISVTLASENAMSQKHSPFQTIGSLTEYAKSLMPG
jgi:D-alanine--poly(phosphoribitol) ligase subunit 2